MSVSLEYLQNEFKTVRETLERIEDHLEKRLDDQESRLRIVEKRLSMGLGALKVVGLLITATGAVLGWIFGVKS